MKLKKSLKLIAIASSLFLATNFMACATNYINKHRIGNQEYQIKNPKHKYAILILGAESSAEDEGIEKELNEYLKNKSLKVYEELKSLGISDDDIYFLSTWHSSKDMKYSDNYFTNYRLHQVCEELSKKITKDDVLLFIYIGHGMINDAGKYTVKKNESEPGGIKEYTDEFYAFNLKSELSRLEYSYAISIIDTCHSGGFAKELGEFNMVSISSTCENQDSWVFSQFPYYIIKALNNEREADTNKDNKVSLEEAVYYAAKKDFWLKKKRGIRIFFPEPQIYYEGIDPSKVFLKE